MELIATNSDKLERVLTKQGRIPERVDENVRHTTGTANEDPYPCDACRNLVREDIMIQCEMCDRWLCCECQGISPDLASAIHRFKNLHWYCMSCEAVAVTLIKTKGSEESPGNNISSVAEETANLIVAGVTDRLDNLVSLSQQQMKATYSEVVSDMSKITGVITKTSRSHPHPRSTTDEADPRAYNCSQVSVEEYLEREKRKLNLVVHGRPTGKK